MEKRTLGRTGLHVSRIGLGTMTWGRDTDEHEAANQLRIYLDAGGSFIDTAAVYGDGDAERVIGGFLGTLVGRSSHFYGYRLQMSSPGRLLNALKWDDRVDPLFWQKVPTLFERGMEHGITVTNIAEKRYEGSAFTQAALRGAKYVGANRSEEMVNAAAQALAEPYSFTYLYINALDHAGHNDGVGSEKWMLALSQVAELITSLMARLPKNTDLYVTADHGMVNVGEKIILGQDNGLMNNITLVGGEPRARHMYVAQGSAAETIAQWREYLGERATIYSREEMVANQTFGAVVSQDSLERMGDFMAIANDEMILIDPERASQESSMVGHHGGVTEMESAIPLLKFL